MTTYPPLSDAAPFIESSLASDVDTLLDVGGLEVLHASAMATAGWPEVAPALPNPHPLLVHALQNHRCNTLLWNEEDRARRKDVPDSEIAANKRAIDRYNQQRNDAIEAMDDVILGIVARHGAAPHDDAWINSETAGSVIDRMSIGTLKTHHMALQCQRTDADAAHIERCRVRLESLHLQRTHLGQCLRRLLAGMLSGTCLYRVHRQFKMYNDPTLNPFLYRAAQTREPAR
ncbi:DUF4254 domain-containing protein [Paracidovorax citrulli]